MIENLPTARRNAGYNHDEITTKAKKLCPEERVFNAEVDDTSGMLRNE